MTPASPTSLSRDVLEGSRKALAQAITLVESGTTADRLKAESLIEHILPATGKSIRIGITGTPGVGKSTFINAFGSMLLAAGRKVAVLAVDPSSTSNGGSILGDKTRMTDLANNPNAFVRPSPSRGVTGGIAPRTREAVLVCEAGGFDTIIIETVGVGQSETAVAAISDLFLLLVSPGGGDDLQGIKRGIMELADIVVVNKADGPTTDLAEQTAGDYRTALHMVRPKHPGVTTEVHTCSSTTTQGVLEVWEALNTLHSRLRDSGYLGQLRATQLKQGLTTELQLLLFDQVLSQPAFVSERERLEQAVANGRMSVSAAARALLQTANLVR